MNPARKIPGLISIEIVCKRLLCNVFEPSHPSLAWMSVVQKKKTSFPLYLISNVCLRVSDVCWRVSAGC